MENEKISVIMSTYNEKIEHLKEAINSIINQTYNNIEFIIVLDNPNNIEIRNLVYTYQQKDSRIIVIQNKENIGLTNSLNIALEKATGKYIARMDADDISKKNRLEIQYGYIKKYNIDILGAGVDEIDEEGKIVKKFNAIPCGDTKIKKILNVSTAVLHPTWMVKKQVYLDLNKYDDIHTAEDYAFLLKASKSGKKIDNINISLLEYRLTTNSISRSNVFKQFLTSEYLRKNYHRKYTIKELKDYLDKNINNLNMEKFQKTNYYINTLKQDIINKKYIDMISDLFKLIISSRYSVKIIKRDVLYKIYNRIL